MTNLLPDFNAIDEHYLCVEEWPHFLVIRYKYFSFLPLTFLSIPGAEAKKYLINLILFAST